MAAVICGHAYHEAAEYGHSPATVGHGGDVSVADGEERDAHQVHGIQEVRYHPRSISSTQNHKQSTLILKTHPKPPTILKVFEATEIIKFKT